MKTRLITYLIIALMYSTAPGHFSLGCNVPVFRYALERWVPSQYVLEIYQDSPLNGLEKELVEKLDSASVSGGGQLNLTVNINSTESPHFDRGLHADLPGMVLYFPDDTPHLNPIWAGPLTASNVEKLIDSPARSRIREELQGEKTAVFLILSSSGGDRDREKNIFTDQVLAKAEEEIYITAPGTDIHGNPIKNHDFSHAVLKFSTVFVDRMDPEEEILARILLGTEKDLWDYDVPMAFPVFGRGRVLYALVGNGINKPMLYEACSAVTGWCSCVVKDENPGTDLLMQADWETGLGESWIQPVELPELAGIAAFAEEGTESDDQVPEFFRGDSPGETPIGGRDEPMTLPPDEAEESPGLFFTALLAVLFVSIVVLSWLIFRRRDL